MLCGVEDARRYAERRIRQLEATIARLDSADPEEVDEDEYEMLLNQLVRARETVEVANKRSNRHALQKRP